MSHRIAKIQSWLKQREASAFFVTNPKNIFYLTGFIGISPADRESSLLVTQNEAYLFVPTMYESRSRHGSRLRALESGKQNYEIVVDHERYGLLTSFTKFVKAEDSVFVEANNLTLAEFEKIQSSTKAKLAPEKLVIENWRIKKDEQEISYLQKACKITDQTFNAIVKLLQSTDYTNITEMDIVDYMRATSRELGADGFGFDPIIASGKGAAEPHYFTSTKKLAKNNCLLLDFGFAYKGYTADLTRTIFLGETNEEFKTMYSLVKECNEICIQACKPGIIAKEFYDISYNFFKKHNLEKHYLHSLGHGVGLDVHEVPSIGANQDTMLEHGMVITIEPGLYFPQKFGVRIEDVILVSETGCVVLSSQSSKEFIQI